MSKALLIYAPGSEDIEITAPADILTRGGVEVVRASLMDYTDITLAHGTKVVCDLSLKDLEKDSCFDVILVPGGMPGSRFCAQSGELIELLKKQKKAGRLIAAICAAPGYVLAGNGILGNAKATGYPGCTDNIKNCSNQGVEVSDDGLFITGKGPAFALQFGLKVLEKLQGAEIATQVAKGMLF